MNLAGDILDFISYEGIGRRTAPGAPMFTPVCANKRCGSLRNRDLIVAQSEPLDDILGFLKSFHKTILMRPQDSGNLLQDNLKRRWAPYTRVRSPSHESQGDQSSTATISCHRRMSRTNWAL